MAQKIDVSFENLGKGRIRMNKSIQETVIEEIHLGDLIQDKESLLRAKAQTREQFEKSMQDFDAKIMAIEKIIEEAGKLGINIELSAETRAKK